MSTAKSLLPRLEVLVIIVFFIGFLVWAVSKCGAKKSELQSEITATIDSTKVDSSKTATALPSPVVSAADTTKATLTTTGAVANPQQLSRLYVTINNLKLRTGPSLDSAAVEILPLFEEVYFLNEVTEFTTELSLGYEMANEPWVKVRSKKGKDGWVYGAGVHYYKAKRKGVLE